MSQLGLNLVPPAVVPAPVVTPKRPTGAELRDAGMQRAVDHADREIPSWQDLALDAFRAYARAHREFTTEDVRLGSPNVPTPPDKRAWGHVARRACREMVVQRIGLTQAKSPTVHAMYVTLYRSTVGKEAA